ncbi:hypothetical protein TYRP_006091, partial [Tyrophagus putrescentiae]
SNHHSKTMDPPQLQISDLSWIAIFQEFTPNEQMVASKMSLRCAGLVRAANLKVKSLVITDRNVEDPSKLALIKDQINCFSLASKPAMQPLMDIPGEPSFPDYPMITRLSKWHCLMIDLREQIDTATTEQIVYIFSAVTDLKYITLNNGPLVPLLQHPKWQRQLTDLMAESTMWLDCQQGRELVTAINSLTALQHLALDWYSDTDLPDLPILAQLKVVAFRSFELHAFMRSLERYATDKSDLQVHLLKFSDDTDDLLSLSQPLHSRIVRYGIGYLDYPSDPVPLFCSQFRSLTSISISSITVTDVVPLFTALSQLHQLVHLRLSVDLWSREELPPPARSLAQLNTVRALELCLSIDSHSQVQWLNLPKTMPNLQAIYIEWFSCHSCGVRFSCGEEEDELLPLSPLNSSSALNCLKSSLFTLHCGVPMNRLILPSDVEFVSAEKLLLQSANRSRGGDKGDTALVERVVRFALGQLQLHAEEQLRSRRVEVHGQGHLGNQDKLLLGLASWSSSGTRIHLKQVSARRVKIFEVMRSWFALTSAPCSVSPETPKEPLSATAAAAPPPAPPPAEASALSLMIICSCSSSSDQPLACATNCLVAVMYASGLKRPPSQMVSVLRAAVGEALMRAICFSRSAKSVTHWMTVQLSGHLYADRQCPGIMPFARHSVISRW